MLILGWVVFGALTGWIASKIVNKRGEGCMVNTALGLLGAVVGGFIFRQLTGFAMSITASSPRCSWRCWAQCLCCACITA